VSPGPNCVLDASALLAFLRDEPGAEVVERALEAGAAIRAANWAEVLSKAAEVGEDP
jgi:PIN domain nuclease of toxin-antitoxin system